MGDKSLNEWIESQNELLDWEREEETGQLTDKISSLSAKACQSEGFSLLNLEVDSTRSALFGRCCLTIQKADKSQLLQSFKVGDEVSLYNPKLSSSQENAVLFGLIGKVTPFKIEMIVDDFDDHLFEPPLRMDLRSSTKTHTSMKEALKSLQHEGHHHPLVNLLFNPENKDSNLLIPTQNTNTLGSADLWNQSLNDSQQRAIQCALDSPSVAIIHGPPGTGKTSTLTELILQAVNRGMRVLVCAPSNIAVDTILGRLAHYHSITTGHKATKHRNKASLTSTNRVVPIIKHALQMVRIGHPARISAKILKYALDSIISRDEATEIVQDVRKDIDQLRTEMGKKGKRGKARDDPTVSFAQIRREQRIELRSLMKEARKRERTVVRDILKRSNVVFSTCVGAASRLLEGQSFDLVVIDEAAQGLEAACWIPIMKMKAEYGAKCVLAGDHCQLPPTIKSGRAEKGGLGVTLFERIIKDSRFQAVVRLLDTQYRMNRRISDWASVNMYHGAIRSHPSVAEHTLRDILPGEGGSPTEPNKNTTTSSSSTDSDSSSDEDDVSSVQPPTSAQKTDQGGEELYPVLLLVDTSGLGMFEDSALETAGSGEAKKLSASHRNFHEADLVRQHVLSLVRAGVKPSQIGVITPYNGQLEVLRELLFPTDTTTTSNSSSSDNTTTGKVDKNFKKPPKPVVHNPLQASTTTTTAERVNLEGLEIKTIDGFQGGEKECILLSLVRSNNEHNVGFLGEKRRINVAVTRAKRHLAVFCDSDTCSVDSFMRTLLEHMSAQGDHLSAQEYIDFNQNGGYAYTSTTSTEMNTVEGSEVRSSSKPNQNITVLKELQQLTSAIEKSDLLSALNKLKDGINIPADYSNTDVINISIPEESTIKEEEKQKLKERIQARYYCNTKVLRFPSSMNSYLRMLVHECAEELQLQHRSVGEGRDRWIEVAVGEFPPDSEQPVGGGMSKAAVKRLQQQVQQHQARQQQQLQGKVAATEKTPSAPLPTQQQQEGKEADPESSSEEDNQDGTAAPASKGKSTNNNAAKKRKPKKSQQKPGAVAAGAYMSADRCSALGRLEEQHLKDIKQNAEDEDALLEAAILHNQKVAHLHQYRVSSAGALPNPDQARNKERLQGKVAEAAMARARGGAEASVGASSSSGTGAGGGGGVGRLAGSGSNIFGFTNTSSSSTDTGRDNGNKTSTNSSSGGGKKKVLKKPPPNFGGGVLGSK